jgi:hypothetical protein
MSRLVWDTLQFLREQARSKASARTAQASTTCSQLSRTKRISRSLRSSAIASVGERPGISRMLRTLATAWGTSQGSETGASSTHYTPSSKRAVASSATAEARRVLPMPPGPVSVTVRDDIVCTSGGYLQGTLDVMLPGHVGMPTPVQHPLPGVIEKRIFGKMPTPITSKDHDPN